MDTSRRGLFGLLAGISFFPFVKPASVVAAPKVTTPFEREIQAYIRKNTLPITVKHLAEYQFSDGMTPMKATRYGKLPLGA